MLRDMDPEPWAEGERVPWDDPDFSQRVLREHLAQDDDSASRPSFKIQKHVQWIQRHLLKGKPGKILDLACGPGLYTSRLSTLGNICTGIDFAPAAIDYALKLNSPGCRYILEDVRRAEYGADYDLVMNIFGALNLVRPSDARLILRKSYAALKPGGLFLLEVSSLESVDQIGNQPAMWYSAVSSIFSDKPHLCLMENFWNEEQHTATERFYIIDTATGQVTHHAASTQGYDEEELVEMLENAGFREVTFYPSLTGREEDVPGDFFVISARKPAAGSGYTGNTPTTGEK